jgi:nitrogen regulatory protein PII
VAKKPFISNFFSRLTSRQDQPLHSDSAPPPPKLKLVFFIVDWQRANIVADVFAQEKVRFHFITKAIGTATSEILDILGIAAVDKAVVLCLEQAVGVMVLLKEVRKKFGQNPPGGGIAFAVPLSAINDPVLLVFKQSIRKNEKFAAELGQKSGELSAKSEGEKMADKSTHSTVENNTMEGDTMTHNLIMAIVNQGYSDELMNTARKAGASGGTVLSARGQIHEGAVKFFGISVQAEKELILILASREKKSSIMRAVCEAHGLNTKAQGLVFSLPADNVMSLSF